MPASTHGTIVLVVASATAAILLSASCDAQSHAQSNSSVSNRLLPPDGGLSNDNNASAKHSNEGALGHRQREGTRLANEQGFFRATGDRLTFHLNGSEEKYPGLENLALERITKIMSDRHDHPDQLVWEVSGFFTEYRGGNYLFVTHAVLKNKSRRRSTSP